MFNFPYIGIIFALFIIIFFLSGGRYKLPDKIASVFILFLVLPLLNKIFINRLLFITYGNILSIESYYLLYGIILYFYVKSVIDKKFKLKKIYLLHLIPFIIFSLWQINYPIPKTLPPPQRIVEIDSVTGVIKEKSFHSTESPEALHNTYGPEAGIPPQDEPICKKGALFFYIFLILSYAIYSFITLLFIYKWKTQILDFPLPDFSILNLKRMQGLTICFICLSLFVFITTLTKPGIFLNPFYGKNESSDIAITLFITLIIVFNIIQSIKYEKFEFNKNHNCISVKKYERSGLKEEEAEHYLNALEKFMKSEKPYLDCDLTISDLSEKLDIPRHYLTQVINEKLNKNFFMYVNEYRVNEIKKMMADNQFHNYTILRLAYQSGFNSKSRFNKAFKKFTGHTPSEYKKFLSNSFNNSNIA